MMELGFQPVPDGRLGYVDLGPDEPATPPVVLLHGGSLDHRMWAPQLAAFPQRRLIAPDLRGHGSSSTPAVPFRHGDDVIALLDALRIERAVLAGLSLGGSTAVDVALEHPDRVAGLLVSGTGTSEPDWLDPWILDLQHRWVDTAAAGDSDGWIAAFCEVTHGPHRTRADVDPQVWSLVETMVRDTVNRHVLPLAPRPPVLPVAPSRTWERVPQLTVPVQVVVGAIDADDHLRLARRLADLTPDSRYSVVDGAAHYPNLERPAAFNTTITTLLDRTT